MGKKIYYGWWVVSACFPIGLYASGVVFYGLTAFFDPFVKEFGWSHTEVSFAASLRGIESGIFSPILGFFVDRFGSRKLILAGTILTGAALLLLSLTRSLAMFYVSFFLLSLGTSGCMGLVTMTAVANWFDKGSGKAFGVMSSAFGASGLIVPLIVWLTDVFHWRTALVILGLGMWGLGVPLSFVIRQKPEGEDGHSGERLRTDSNPQHRHQTGTIDLPLKEILKQRAFLHLVLAETVRVMAVGAVVTHVMPYLGHKGMSRPAAGMIAAMIPIMSIVGRFGFGWFADVYRKKYVMALAFVFMDLGVFAFAFAGRQWPIPFFLFFFSVGLGGGMVMRVTILREFFGGHAFGRLLGIVMGAAALGGTIGPTMAGWFFDTFRDYHLAWFVLLGLVSLSIVLILTMKPRPSHTG